ncbi:MAG TPA: type II toxin-antitoxin system RelE/ParE family toxin [Polyangiaceae bacterium]|jgi:mRNA-degrading endonuclease RelE of RelBE toxin-antitoxin system
MVVLLTPEAQADFDALPVTIRARVLRIFERLRGWPSISVAKALTWKLAGHYRSRTGDWRVIFRVVGSKIIVVNIKHRSKVYED